MQRLAVLVEHGFTYGLLGAKVALTCTEVVIDMPKQVCQPHLGNACSRERQ